MRIGIWSQCLGAMQFTSLLDVEATFGLLYGNESE
jgi:hypothetical protein